MEDTEIMSNLEYDALYDELSALEKETGMVMSNSPTVKVGYEVVSELPKEAHEHPMLSLDKTKDVGALASWLGGQKGVISWKMDGLTVVLTYENGEMIKAVTRGNGEIGEVITNNAKVFANVPHHIPYKGKLTIRGEAVIKYSDFNAINEKITDAESKYKNPRNLCSGSVRQLDNKITKERNVHFFAFNLVDGEDVDFHNSFKYQLDWLEQQGFTVVEHYLTDSAALPDKMREFSEKITENDFPRGLVLMLDDLAYGRSLGTTAKFPRNAMAFKWADEEAITHLRYVEWSPSRTGLINPVAVFDPVELEGTTVSRASIHNVSILKSLALGEGDEIAVYKANMIIPQIARNLTMSGNVVIPAACPACGGETEIVREEGGAVSGVETLYCTNQFCPAKKLKSFSHYVSRNALNIDGLSEATIEKFIDEKILEELPDLYKLAAHREHIVELEGFWREVVQQAWWLRWTHPDRRTCGVLSMVSALQMSGEATAKLMAKHFANDMDAMKKADVSAYVEIDGIGQVIAEDIVRYFENEKNCAIIDRLMVELTFVDEVSDTEQDLAGKVFVITGSLTHFDNRNQLKELIESRGGQVTGSVSAKTSYLINNDVNSTSSKNKKAKSLDVPIISEEDFLELIGQ